MKENNPHILMQAIHELPVYSPDELLWDRLENSMFPFPVDELPQHQPDANLWESIEGSMAKSSLSKIYLKRGLLLTALLLISLFILYKYQASHKTVTIAEIESNKTNHNPESHKSNLNVVPLQEESPDQVMQIEEISENIDNTYILPVTTELIKNVDHKQNLITSNHHNESFFAEISNMTTRNERLVITGLSPRKGALTTGDSQSFPFVKEDLTCSPFTGNDAYFSMGLLGRYDQFLKGNQVDGTCLQEWNTLEIELSYHPGKMFFTTGLGVIFSSDKSQIAFSYLQNELIDSYIYVDSVYYDPISGTTQYFTTTVDVYDSIEYGDTAHFTSQYQYLKVPFSIGCELFSNKHFSVSLSGGVSWMHLIQTNPNHPALYKENARILNSTYKEVTRTQDLFQLSLHLDLHYRVSRHVMLKIGPSFNYFTHPIYQNASVANPYSWSIGAGVQYNF